MNSKDFEELFESRVQKLRDLFFNKAKEYASDEDRMYNFKRGSEVDGDHPCKILDSYMLKHYVSYKDIIKKIQSGGRIDQIYLDDKLGDIIAYFILQEALMYDMDCVNMVIDAEYEETPEHQTSSFMEHPYGPQKD